MLGRARAIKCAMAGLVAWGLSGASFIESAPAQTTQRWLILHVDLAGRGPYDRPIPVDQVRRDLRQKYDLLDRDGKSGISANDYELADQDQLTRLRAEQVRNFLNFDSDGDGVVTRDEIEFGVVRGFDRPIEFVGEPTSLFPHVRPANEERIADLMKADGNKDGRITLDEMLAPPPVPQHPLSWWSILADRDLLGLDENADGNVSSDEFERALQVFIAGIDIDADGSISPAERQAALARFEPTRLNHEETVYLRSQAAAMRRKAWYCALPQPATKDRVLLIGTQKGIPLTTSGRNEGDVSQLIIEDGSEPLYIVATSLRPTTWQVSGDTKRVVMFVAMAQDSHGGQGNMAVRVSGLEGDKVYSPPKLDCLVGLSSADGIVKGAGARLSGLIGGRMPDGVAGFDVLDTIRLPSGVQAR